MEWVEALDEGFKRSEAFNRTEFWRTWVRSYERSLASYPVVLEVSPEMAPELPFILGEQAWPALRAGTKTPDGWTRLEYVFERFDEARGHLMGLGDQVRIREPRGLADSIYEQARAIIVHFEEGSG